MLQIYQIITIWNILYMKFKNRKQKKVANHRPLPYSTANYQNSFIRASKCKPQTTLSIHIPYRI